MKHAVAASIGLAMLGLVLGYGTGSRWGWALAVVILGLLWLAGQRYDRGWMADWGMIGFVAAAGYGVWLRLPAFWMLAGIVAALVAWDLERFSQHLRSMERVDGADELIRSHLQRLLAVAGVGLLLGGVALGIEVDLNFGWAFLLGLLAILGLSQAIGFMRQKSD